MNGSTGASSVKPIPFSNCTPAFNSELFNLTQSRLPEIEPAGYQRLDLFCNIGLVQKDLFTEPVSTSLSSLHQINDFHLSNAYWSFPKLLAVKIGNNKERKNTTLAIHQDEGYITPDQDLICKCKFPCFSWDNLQRVNINNAYSWESYGVVSEYKSFPHIFLKRYSSSQIWSVVHAYDVTASLEKASVPVTLNLDELGVSLKNLLTGIESNIFQYSYVKNTFVMQDGLNILGLSEKVLFNYCEPFIQCANYFYHLSNMLSNSHKQCHGISSIFKTLRDNIKCYLQCYNGIILEMLSMQNILQTYLWAYTLQNHLYFLLDIFQEASSLSGGSLLALLYDQVPLTNNNELSFILNYILKSCCNVYFSLLKKWIFEGECIDVHKEFFIEALNLSESLFTHKFWSHAFVLNKVFVPGFLKGVENDILLCGKSMALLQLCNQDDPLCLGVKQGYPNLTCCLNNAQLEKLEEECLVYKQRIYSLSHGGNEDLPPDHDSVYYASLRAQSLSRITKKRDEEKRRLFEKKQCEMRILKKDEEDRRIFKMHINQVCLEEETNILKKKNISNHLNNLRIIEERQHLLNCYSAKYDVTNRRIQRAEWKRRRLMLSKMRIEFFNEEQKQSSETKVDDVGCNSPNRKTSTLLSTVKESDNSFGASKSLDDYKKNNYHGKIKQTSKLCNVSKTHVDNVSFQENFTIQEASECDVTEPLDDVKRQWSMALYEANQARQSASTFKERNMYSSFNILTGEDISSKEKFNHKQNELLLQSMRGDAVVQSNHKMQAGISDCNIPNELSLIASIFEKSIDIQSDIENTETALTVNDDEIKTGNDKDQTNFTQPLFTQPNETSVLDVEMLNTKNESPVWNCFEMNCKHKNSFKKIDMTTIYQHLQSSIKIPLMIQLKLTNDAVWRLFFRKHNLIEHLKCIKQYFFFFDGNFSKVLAATLFQDIQTSQQPSHLLNVSMLNSLMRLSIGPNSNEEYTERLSFFINVIPEAFRLVDPEALNCISMQYKTHWPLNVIITDAFIYNCDKVFRFLLQLQRVSWVLEQDVYLLKIRLSFDDHQFRQINLFRHVMSHFVNTLKMYVYSVAVEESWKKYEKNIQKVKTLDDIYEASVGYIKTVLFRCMLNKKSKGLQKELVHLFGIILKFHEALRSGQWIEENGRGMHSHSNYQSVTTIFKQFLIFSKILFKKINDIASCGHQPYLMQLTILLSANDFYKE